MTSLSTDQGLLDRLRAASKRPLSAEEVRKQKLSYVIGFVGDESQMTKEKIEEIMARQEGEAA